MNERMTADEEILEETKEREEASPRGRGPIVLRALRVETEYRRDTRSLHRQERARYGSSVVNFLRMDRPPDAGMVDLVGPNADKPFGPEHEAKLDTLIEHYHGRGTDVLVSVLKFFSVYLMEQARKTREVEVQRFLAFKAVDLVRMIVQFSPLATSKQAESLAFGVYIDLGANDRKRFGEYMRAEERVYALMRALESSPSDVQSRMDMAEALVQQTSYFDALVQYHTLLRILHRRGSGSDRSRAWVVSRIGDMFQDMAEHQGERMQDGRKLRAFIARFNRGYARKGEELPQVRMGQRSEQAALSRALLNEACRWYLQAASSPMLEPQRRVALTGKLAQNLILLGRNEEALSILEAVYPAWDRVPEREKNLSEKVSYLQAAVNAAVNLRQRDLAAWATRELGGAQQAHQEVESIRLAREARQAAMFED